MPAILIFVDNYVSFKEKTGERYEETMITLSKEGVSQGIFLVVSGGGIGMNDITSRVCENITLSLCLQLQEKYEYIELLHTNQIEVLPESGIKGRGLADYEGRILEFQTALSKKAENDYERMEGIRSRCEEMKAAWNGKMARQIPKIPKKPVWSQFHVLDEYQKMRRDKTMLPVAYNTANAQIYGIDLRHSYCYMVYGTAHSGKTNFLKVCVQAAIEKGGQVCVIDQEQQEFKSYASEKICYAADEKSIHDFFLELQPVFAQRNQKKHALLNQDCEEDEIYAAMSKEAPYYIFIADMKWFVQMVNQSQYNMKGFLVNILSKGSLHHIYFFSAISLKDHLDIFGDELYEAFTGYQTGIHFGGNTAENRVLNYDYIPFAEQSKALAPGIGCLPEVMTEEEPEKIIVPLARR